MKCLRHLPSDGEYSSKVNIFSDDLEAETETKLLAVTETESRLDRDDPGRKGLPNFLKILRD